MKITFENIFLFGGKNEKQIYVWGGVLATLFLAILFCFASCDNGSTPGSSEKNPEELVSYELNGDAIKLYDDNTFVITLKENAGTISGTYSNLTSCNKLMVTKASGDIAKSGDILRLSIAEGKVSVVSSDITRYSAGDDVEQISGTPPTTPSGGQGSADSDKDNSLGDAPNGNRLSEKYFKFEECDDGIYLECTVPAGTFQSHVYIDGVGQVAEQILYNDKKNRGSFFYPFLTPGKEYAVRVVFSRDEDKNEEGYVIGHIGDGTIGWFETKVTAGANSKGEVRPKEHGEVKVENNGDFKFTKRPTFENENLLTGNGYDWMMDVALVEGVSWMHEGRKTKWSAAAELPQEELNKTHNLYTIECYFKNSDFSIDFICYRPVLYYEYGGKTYNYLWYNDVIDTPELKIWANIDVKNAAAVEKIQGMWTLKKEYDTEFYQIQVHRIEDKMLEIDNNNVKFFRETYTYTKLDGTEFTEDELARIKITYTLSDDGKTLVEEYEDSNKTVSEYFAGYDNESYSRHYDLKFFADKSTLRIINSGKDHGTYYSYIDDYKKQ